MSTLLNEVIEAHGGLQRWQALSDVITEFEIDGKLCAHANSKEFLPARAFFSLRHPYIIMVDRRGGQTVMIDSNRMRSDESQREIRPPFAPGAIAPDANLARHHVSNTVYFLACALRHYATAPFLYAAPGFAAEEVDPWNEGGETWRVLRVAFPPHVEAPARTQYAYYGADGFLRRTRYHLDTSPLKEFVNYVHAYEQVDGIWLPTSRQVLGCDPGGYKIPDRRYASVRFVRPFFT